LHRAELLAIAAEEEMVRNGTHPAFVEQYSALQADSVIKMACAEHLAESTRERAKKEHRLEMDRLKLQTKNAKQNSRKRLLVEVEGEKEKCKAWYENAKIDSDADSERGKGRQTRRRAGRADIEADAAAAAAAEAAAAVAAKDNALPIFELDLNDADLEEDMQIMADIKPHKLAINRALQRQDPRQEYECYYEHLASAGAGPADRLKYDNKWYYRFQKVTLEQQGSSKITGQIFMLSPVTMWIRRKIKGLHQVLVGDLKKGKVILRLATGREN
jgi:hypothetical protein